MLEELAETCSKKVKIKSNSRLMIQRGQTVRQVSNPIPSFDNEIDLNPYLRDVASVIDFEALSDLILAGHSYAGMIISALADKLPCRISRLVSLDAIVPIPEKSFLEIAGPGFQHLLGRHATGASESPAYRSVWNRARGD
jgi:pimeloyl-ACP methyl ester carboxylesterase